MKKRPPGVTKWATTCAQRADVGHPAEDAARRVDDVEVARRGRPAGRNRFDSDEARPSGEADLGGGRVARSTAAWLKSAPVTLRPEPCPRQRVDPEVALEVEQLEPGDVADLLDARSRGAGSPPRLKPSRS